VETKIRVTGEGSLAADGLAEEIATVPGIVVEPRRASDQLAMDPTSVTLIVGALGTVNAFIAALGSVVVAKLSSSRGHSQTPVRPVLHVHTDLDEVRVTLGAAGEVVVTSGRLPSSLDDITEVHLSTEPA
jgi:hypothetical protein